MKKIFHIIIIMCMIPVQMLLAQTPSALYITGSAVPGGVQQLEAFPNNLFKFAGTLQEGTLIIMNTPEQTATTTYYKPRYEDSYIINNGLLYTQTTKNEDVEWVVPLTEDRYRFTVDTGRRTVTGELFQPWNELFIVGGCVSCGWNSYFMLPFTRVEGEICTYTWTGQLRERNENNEPRRFKFTGQNAWEPKVLHPFRQDADILSSGFVRTNGTEDNKWQITKDGIYTITIDVFREKSTASYVGK